MITLSYGFKQPENLDEGSVVFPALEANWAQINSHNHNGTNSAKIASSSITTTTIAISNANWILVADGHYYQNVVIPNSGLYDNFFLTFKLSTGEQVFPSVSKVAASTFRVDFDDNTQDLTCYL